MFVENGERMNWEYQPQGRAAAEVRALAGRCGLMAKSNKVSLLTDFVAPSNSNSSSSRPSQSSGAYPNSCARRSIGTWRPARRGSVRSVSVGASLAGVLGCEVRASHGACRGFRTESP